MIKVSTTGMAVSLKTDLRFPISGQWGHGDRIIHLINSKRGYLVYSAGIARYKENINFNLIKDMDVIVDTKELGIKYKIFGEPGDFEIEKEVVK